MTVRMMILNCLGGRDWDSSGSEPQSVWRSSSTWNIKYIMRLMFSTFGLKFIGVSLFFLLFPLSQSMLSCTFKAEWVCRFWNGQYKTYPHTPPAPPTHRMLIFHGLSINSWRSNGPYSRQRNKFSPGISLTMQTWFILLLIAT